MANENENLEIKKKPQELTEEQLFLANGGREQEDCYASDKVCSGACLG